MARGTSFISDRAHVVHPFAFACPAAARRLRGRDHPAAPRADLARGMGRMIFSGQAILFREVPVLQVSAQSRDSSAGADDQPRSPHALSIGARSSRGWQRLTLCTMMRPATAATSRSSPDAWCCDRLAGTRCRNKSMNARPARANDRAAASPITLPQAAGRIVSACPVPGPALWC